MLARRAAHNHVAHSVNSKDEECLEGAVFDRLRGGSAACDAARRCAHHNSRIDAPLEHCRRARGVRQERRQAALVIDVESPHRCL
jgi:hypothetical protein